MAAPTIDEAFIKQYESEVHQAYQRQGSKLRGLVRVKSGIVGMSTTFQKTGKGSASTKSRHGTISPMNVDHSTVECTLADYYAGDWIDKLDELKTNIDERMVVANAGAWALGRKTDEMIVDALDTATSGRNVTGTSDLADTAALTDDKVFRAIEILNDGDVPDDGMRFALVGSQQWTNLLNITAFASSEWVGTDALPFVSPTTQAKRWLNVVWVPFNGLPKASTVRSCFMFHKSAIGHAVGAEVSTDITWHGDRAAHFVANSMSQGAVLIDELGVVRIKATET
jgi:hypothetical protein